MIIILTFSFQTTVIKQCNRCNKVVTLCLTIKLFVLHVNLIISLKNGKKNLHVERESSLIYIN